MSRSLGRFFAAMYSYCCQCGVASNKARCKCGHRICSKCPATAKPSTSEAIGRLPPVVAGEKA